jgi:hypothetical protein
VSAIFFAAALSITPALAAVASTAATPSADKSAPKSAGHALDPIESSFVKSAGISALRNQEAIIEFRDWLFAQHGFAGSGYLGSIDDLTHKATTIIWHGPTSPLLKAALQQGARRGITVHVQHRKYSLQQLSAATATVWSQAASGQWAGFKVSSIDVVATHYDGIIVYGTYTKAPATASTGSKAPAVTMAPQVKALTGTASGVSLKVQPGVSAGTSNGRDNDFAPFDAGGLMEGNSGGTICSSGFAVNYGGSTHTTTARHCTDTPYFDFSASNEYGSTAVNSSDGGAKVLSARGAALALDGAWNSNSFYKTVIGFADVGVGDFVCTGGGNSGEHCNVKVITQTVSFNDGIGSFSTIEGMQQTSGAIAQIQGDSGGPVIDLANTSSGQVRATGMIQGWRGSSSTGSACGAVAVAGSNHCSADVLFSSMRTIVNNLSGASLVTG